MDAAPEGVADDNTKEEVLDRVLILFKEQRLHQSRSSDDAVRASFKDKVMAALLGASPCLCCATCAV